MAQIYTIAKKNSLAHKSAQVSHKIKNADIFEVGSTHVLIPSRRSISYGHTVSHAKNRKPTRRLDNLRVLTLPLDDQKKAIRLSNADLRTFKKVSKAIKTA